MERYFPPDRTDLVLFPFEHISHQELLDKMRKDRDEVPVLSAVFNTSLIFTTETYELFSQENMQTGRTDPQEIRNEQSTIFQEFRS